ncbi:MAG TPA: YbhB/YbcL family Raf kinase inhibitor-like protein [Luteimonas sp.]|nr:YbhB/YbcL family Raf kinase inhibitor-like protein [Luteimonas sp.]
MKSIPVLAGALLVACTSAHAQQGDGTDETVRAHVYKPAKVEATAARVASLKAPAGFSVAPFATSLGNVRMLAVAPDGTVYATRRDEGDVVMLRDADRDGRADAAPVVVVNRPGVHGITVHEGRLYLVTNKEIFVGAIQPDGRPAPLTMLLGDLPDAGQHPNRTLAFGPDGMLYVSVGSTCNACNESNPENATLLQVSPDGTSRTIFASGLRNTIGFAWHPLTGELWGMDHGTDYLGDEQQPEELNRIEKGRKYGWPHVHGKGDLHPQTTPPGGITKQEWKQHSEPMVIGYTAHAAPMQMVFAGAGWPAEYRNDAFVAMRGSWNRKPASGYELARVEFDDAGQPERISTFVGSFLSDGGRTHFARPVGLATMPDGALLLGDDANGVIYRLAYTGAAGEAPSAGAGPSLPPAGPMQRQSAAGVGVPLALARDETRSSGTIAVSARFKANAPIPARHSEYADGLSPALSWAAVPGARSYAIVMEDPDAKPITPFVHWVAWNIPASVTALPEGLQEQPRLVQPDGMLQGRTSRGSVGYYGPRPPVGDPPHHYHVQVLALDTVLDVPAGADRDRVLAAAKGHVLARGEVIGTYRQTVKPPR